MTQVTRPKRTWFGKHVVTDENGSPYMLRYWIGRLRLHVFYRGDHDPDPHDHPWDFWTFPLTSYIEEVVHPYSAGSVWGQPPRISHVFVSRQIVRAFRLHYRPATHCHRVLGKLDESRLRSEVGEGKIITIVWRGKMGREWGFLKNRDGKWCWVAFREYLFQGGKSAPCDDP